jgi:hypothetical protein
MVPYDIEHYAAVSPQAEPFLAVFAVAIVSLVVVTIVGAGLLVYFRRRKGKF